MNTNGMANGSQVSSFFYKLVLYVAMDSIPELGFSSPFTSLCFPNFVEKFHETVVNHKCNCDIQTYTT